MKYVPVLAYFVLITARAAKEVDKFRGNGGDAACITVSCLTVLYCIGITDISFRPRSIPIPVFSGR